MTWAFPNAPCIVKSNNMKLNKTCMMINVDRPFLVDGPSSIAHRIPSAMNWRWLTAHHLLIGCLLLSLLTMQGCNIYSFTGAAISPEVKTISIQNFYNDAGGGPPNMSQQFTESLKDYFQQNTNLTLVDENGDLQMEGAITRYDFEPVAPQASGSDQVADVASQMRLTITVEATYVNTNSDEYDFDNKSFSFFADFDADRDPTSVEEELVEEILDQIIFDIFTASVANW